jgi:hypothetical protein
MIAGGFLIFLSFIVAQRRVVLFVARVVLCQFVSTRQLFRRSLASGSGTLMPAIGAALWDAVSGTNDAGSSPLGSGGNSHGGSEVIP